MKLEENWDVWLSSNLSNILNVLLDDIAQNRHCVQTILKRQADAEGEEQLSFTLKQLTLEELLLEEQHLESANMLQNDNLDSSRVVEVIKNRDLISYLYDNCSGETGNTEIRNNVAAVLEELLRCNGISLDCYTTIKRTIISSE